MLNNSNSWYKIPNRSHDLEFIWVLKLHLGTKSNLTNFKQGKSIVLMFFPDVLKFLNRLCVRHVKDVTAQVSADVTAGMDPEGMGALVSTSGTELHEGQNAQPLPVVATASAYALPEEQDLAPVVQEAPSSSLVLPPGCFVVPSKNASMYGKKMRDVHIAGFSMESDKVIRFRSSDGKVAAVDLLVAIGRYSRTDKAQDAMLKLIDRNDEMVKDLMSIQVDKSLTDMVSTYFGIKIFKKKIVPDTWVRGPY
jgi:hypothetical protein